MKDVRIGRGVIGTFPVKPGIFRFPLDLIFSSKGIKVVEIKKLPTIGSDHFPIFSKFSVLSSNYATTEKIDPEKKDEVDEIIKEGHIAVEDD